MKYHLFKFVLVFATLASISPAQAFTTFYFSGSRGFTLGANSSESQTSLSVSFWSPYAFGRQGYGWASFGWLNGWGRPAWGVPSHAFPSYPLMKQNRQYAEDLVQQKIITYHMNPDEDRLQEKQKKMLKMDQKEFDLFENTLSPEILRAPQTEQTPKETISSKDGKITVNYY